MSKLVYKNTKYRYVNHCINGCWEIGFMTENPNVILNEAAGVLQYAQTCFEGMKAYRRYDGDISIVEITKHYTRFCKSAKAIGIPEFGYKMFKDAICEVVQMNASEIPNVGDMLYIRPVIFSSEALLGIRPAIDHELRIFCSPIGNILEENIQKKTNALKLLVSPFDRAAVNGSGRLKIGANYAVSMRAIQYAKDMGYDECLYLDPKYQSYIEESSGANIIFVDKDNTILVAEGTASLDGTVKQLIYKLVKDSKVNEISLRRLELMDVSEAKECYLIGTAAEVTPVALIDDKRYANRRIEFTDTKEGFGTVGQQLAQSLEDLYLGKVEDEALSLTVISDKFYHTDEF